MTVTVLLPVYNGASTLDAAIRSVLEQELADFELLVIDDRSTDASADVIRAWAGRDPRVRPVLHERNLGLATTLNEGLELASGDLVARLDQDDECLPRRLSVQVQHMHDHPGTAVCGSFVYHMGATPTDDRLVELPTEPAAIRDALRTYNCMYHPSVMLRRSAVLALGGYRGEFKNAEDYDLWLRVAAAHDIENLPVPLIRYRFSVDGMTLGRKWEQLYYVQLAQAAAADPDASLEDAGKAAEQALASTDRAAFLRVVAEGTVQELIRLRLWRDATAVALRFRGEIGSGTTASLLARIARARVSR